jgi:hypothetical protein
VDALVLALFAVPHNLSPAAAFATVAKNKGDVPAFNMLLLKAAKEYRAKARGKIALSLPQLCSELFQLCINF